LSNLQINNQEIIQNKQSLNSYINQALIPQNVVLKPTIVVSQPSFEVR